MDTSAVNFMFERQTLQVVYTLYLTNLPMSTGRLSGSDIFYRPASQLLRHQGIILGSIRLKDYDRHTSGHLT